MTGTIETLANAVKRSVKRNPGMVVTLCVKHLYLGSEYLPIHSHESDGVVYEVERNDNVLKITSDDGHALLIRMNYIPDETDDRRYNKPTRREWDWSLRFDGVDEEVLDDSQYGELLKFLYGASELGLYDKYGRP